MKASKNCTFRSKKHQKLGNRSIETNANILVLNFVSLMVLQKIEKIQKKNFFCGCRVHFSMESDALPEPSFIVAPSQIFDYQKRIDVQPARRAREPGKTPRLSCCFAQRIVLTCSQFAVTFGPNGESVEAFHFNGFPVQSAISDDGKRIVVGFSTGTVLLVAPQKKVCEEVGAGSVIGLFIDESLVWVAFQSGKVLTFDSESDKRAEFLPVLPLKNCTDMAVSSSIVALCDAKGVCRLFDRNKTCVGTFSSYFGAFLSVDLCGDFAAAGGEDDLVSIFSVSRGVVVLRCVGCTSFVQRLSFLPPSEGKLRLVAVCDSRIVFFEFDEQCNNVEIKSSRKEDVPTVTPVGYCAQFTQRPCDVAWTNETLVVAFSNGTAATYSTKQTTETKTASLTENN
jgi:WD40 repeat protein